MDDKSKEFLEATGGDAREAQTQPPQTAEAEREAAAPIAEEAAKLAPILRSLCEGPSGDPEEMYEPDFEPSDGDCYVVRAAELLELLAAALSSRPVQGGERVAVGWQRADGSLHKGCPPFGEPDGWEPVYTLSSAPAQPVREPMSEEQAEQARQEWLYSKAVPNSSAFVCGVRFAERHHGITKE